MTAWFVLAILLGITAWLTKRRWLFLAAGTCVVVFVALDLRRPAATAPIAASPQRVAYAAPPSPTVTAVPPDCQSAGPALDAASKAKGAKDYQRLFDVASPAIATTERCPVKLVNVIARAELVADRALAEHELKSGDWQTDLNLAKQLFQKCVTDPDWYGTETSGQCETMQKYLIEFETHWDMERWTR